MYRYIMAIICSNVWLFSSIINWLFFDFASFITNGLHTAVFTQRFSQRPSHNGLHTTVFTQQSFPVFTQRSSHNGLHTQWSSHNDLHTMVFTQWYSNNGHHATIFIQRSSRNSLLIGTPHSGLSKAII